MDQKNIWSFMGHFLKPYKTVVAFYIFLALLAGCWGPFNGLLIKYLINSVNSAALSGLYDSWLLVCPAALLVLNFIVCDNITWRSIGYLDCKFQPIIKNNIVNTLFVAVSEKSPQFFQDNLSGSIAHNITILADHIERILHRVAIDFLRGISLLVCALVSMYWVNSKFFGVLILWFVVFAGWSILKSKRFVTLSHMYAEAEQVVSGQLVDVIANINNVRLFARRTHERTRLNHFLDTSKNRFRAKETYAVNVQCVQGFLIAVMLGSMLYYLIVLYSRYLVNIGDFALIAVLSMEVGHMSWYTMKQVDNFNESMGKCKQSLNYLLASTSIKDKVGATDLVVTQGEIVFSNVSFNYPQRELLFQNKSIIIKSGQKVGLVGYSGSGKSTFVNVMLRLYDVTEGAILIDGHDITGVTQNSLYNSIAMIPQDPSLFHRSLKENIRYGRIEASDQEVIEAARKAHADEFIMKLPQGYDSQVGERGIKLSGGQRQRIAIARAILKNAPILILDEATSQLDSVTEKYIQDSLHKLMQGKTTLVIAHRLSTVLGMDRILVFDKGKIVEDGSHTELLARNGLYKILWDSQVDGFLPEVKTGI